MKRMLVKRDLGLAVLLVLGASCIVIAAGITPGREPGFPSDSIQASAPAIVLTGNAAVDAYFNSNGTTGLSWATAYKLQNQVINPLGGVPRNALRLTNTNRYVIIQNCTLNCPAVSTGYAAIELSNASHVYMSMCKISCDEDAIKLVNSNHNIFFKNSITIAAPDRAFNITTSLNNSIYMNAIYSTNTSTNAAANCLSTGNFWDNGTRGNFWSNYVARYTTATNNGIYWNTSYIIAGAAGAQDNRPLVRSPFIANRVPRLTVASGTPGTGNQNTPVTFQITYTDADNDAPTSIFVIVGGATQPMTKVNTADVTYNNGCTYRYIGYLQPGNHTYSFTCSDGLLTNTTVSYGPIVVTKTNTNAPRLTSVSFSPATGDETTRFTFRVTYTDADNNAPTTIAVMISGTPYSMAKEDPTDTNLMNGCWYSCITTLPVGNHTFSMQCSDGTNANSTTTAQGPVVTLSAGAQATQVGITVTIVIGCIAGGILAFAALVIYRDRLPLKMQRVIPSKYAIKDAGYKIKDGTKSTGGKVKEGFGKAGYKIRTFFSDIAFKIRHH